MHTDRKKSPFKNREGLIEAVAGADNMPPKMDIEEMKNTAAEAASEAATSAAAEAAIRELSNRGILKGAMRGMAQSKIKSELLPMVTKVVKRWAE